VVTLLAFPWDVNVVCLSHGHPPFIVVHVTTITVALSSVMSMYLTGGCPGHVDDIIVGIVQVICRQGDSKRILVEV